MKKLFSLLMLGVASLTAQAEDATYHIIFERDTTVSFTLGDISLGSRDIHMVHYEYPSKDVEGNTVNISGSIWVPMNIYDGTDPCDGVVLYNHFTHTKAVEQPSIKGEEVCNGLMVSPLKPNYILVISDYIGFGSTADRPQAYLCGETNARNSLDGLVAARQLMTDAQIPQGKYLFNVGYSQGGTESMFVAKLRDMEYKDRGITFDKTFAGGGPLDFDKAYTEAVSKQHTSFPVAIALMLVSLNENFNMRLDYSKVFMEPLASNIDEWILSKKYGSYDVNDKIGVDSLKNFIQPDYLDVNSQAAMTLREKLKEISLTNGWDPDPAQKYFVQHSRHDTYVGIQSGRCIVEFMKNYGFQPSLVPGKTGLQTNLITFKVDHLISGAIWGIQTAVALQLWPVIYYEGEQNRYYNDVVKDLNLLKAIKLFESLGIDLRKLINSSDSAAGDTDIWSVLVQLTSVLETLNLTISDFLEMITDSGITVEDILAAHEYLTANPEEAGQDADSTSASAVLHLMSQYGQTLASWLLMGGINVEYDKWGWTTRAEEWVTR